MNRKTIATINMHGGLPQDNILNMLRPICHDAKVFAKAKNLKRQYFANNTSAARNLSICSKCEALHMDDKYKLTPISFVAALVYHADFNEGVGVKSFSAANQLLKKDINKTTWLCCAPCADTVSYRNTTKIRRTIFNARQLCVMNLYNMTPPFDQVFKQWRRVRMWDIHADHVDWFERDQPTLQEYLALFWQEDLQEVRHEVIADEPPWKSGKFSVESSAWKVQRGKFSVESSAFKPHISTYISQ